MQFEKRAVRLGDIRPSGQNPREDFGDIGALARSIEATGGEPLNPPVVVADGNVFRIVDGERRYRALSSIYGEDREVSALVADTMDEANELVAMLATDDKRQLTEADALLCAGDTDDGVLFFAGGCMTQPIVLDIMRCFVSEVVRDMVKLGIDETEARGQVMLAAVSPSDASELLLDINLDDRDKIAHIAKELAASDLS